MAFADSFLTSPAEFPARLEGEPWGGAEVTVEVAGDSYRFRGADASQAEVIRRRFPPGGSPAPGAPEVEIRLCRARPESFVQVDRAGWEYRIDASYEAGAVSLAGLGFMARLEWQPGLRAALWIPWSEGRELPGIVENLFRLLVAYRLVERGGALLHSAGLGGAGGVYLCFGTSGAGKSTVARLSQAAGRQVLSDDLNGVVWQESEPRAVQVPFCGDLEVPGSLAPPRALRGLCQLRQGDRHGLERLGPAQGVAALAVCSPFVNADAYRRERLLGNLEALVQKVPVSRLTFARDAGFWELLEES